MASLINKIRPSFRDNFNATLFEGATFKQPYDTILLRGAHYVSTSMQTFSEACNKKTADPEATVCFFEDDWRFSNFCENPTQFLKILKQHPAVVMPDISTNCDFPYWYKGYNNMMNFAFANFLEQQGLLVIPNPRLVTDIPIEAAIGGIPKHSTIAIGAHGNLKYLNYRQRFINDIKTMIDYIEPCNVLVWGCDCYDAFRHPKELGIPINFYSPRIKQAHQRGINERQGA